MTELVEKMALWAMLLGLAAAGPLSADVGSMSVSPSEVMLRGTVGQTTTQTLSFTNKTSRPLSFEMMAQDAIVREGVRSYEEAGTIPAGIAATAVFSPRAFTAAAGESKDIKVTLTIPPNTGVRAIAVMCQGTTKLGVKPLQMTASVGTLFTFALVGDVIAATASPLLIQTPTASSNLVARQDVANSGTEPVVATGMLVILDGTGAMIGRQTIAGWRMLPGEKTPVRVVYDGRLATGHYRAMVTYDLTDKTLTSVAEFDVR
jgi:hypothetical protein